MGIRAAGDHCVLAARGEDAGQYVVVLCDAIGSPLETRYIDVEPRHITMTQVSLQGTEENEKCDETWDLGSRLHVLSWRFWMVHRAT